MLRLEEIRRIRGMGGADVVRTHGPRTRGLLRAPEGVPVVIAARNEQEDLPGTLLALADSLRPVQVWVVVNGTTDDTAARAEEMGAHVLEGLIPSKMASLQLAVRTITQRGSSGPILFTDADTLVGPRWAQVMAARCRAADRPVITLGNALFWDGDSRAADLIRNARKIAHAGRTQLTQRCAIAQGANLAIDFAGSEEALANYLAIDKSRFIGEEEEIVNTILAAGGSWRNAYGMGATVVTRGDRFDLMSLWRLRGDRDFSVRRAMYAEYGDVRPYGSVIGP